MVKQRNGQGRFRRTKLRVIFGEEVEVVALLGKSTAYIERSHLSSRLFNVCQARKTQIFSKSLQANRHAAIWKDCYYNLIHSHKSLRLPVQDASRRKWSPCTLAMAANLTGSYLDY